jgi:hypothetical protein
MPSSTPAYAAGDVFGAARPGHRQGLHDAAQGHCHRAGTGDRPSHAFGTVEIGGRYNCYEIRRVSSGTFDH